ncbi:LETM1-related biofilm-associated protein [Hanstruepera ponticola]|uniref:LETM1-related biofilm-associated protein n=1 Tax=Hanstruepera ponticola TaxID=2042995 RepID=UPI000CF093F3|nr:LETM1-related biofilm-associated protein [Hanstruepera ponticola]
MNPSANGWIKKLLKDAVLIEKLNKTAIISFYESLRYCGFIYGSNIMVIGNLIKNDDFTNEEICKINFLLAFYYTHHISDSNDDFADSVIDFYTKINAHKTTFFSDLLGEKKSNSLLEKIIHKRIQIDDNIIDKSFNYFITNALLFTDILAYKMYLKNNKISESYIQNFESSIETIVVEALNAKVEKSNYDHSLINLFEQSLRYQHSQKISYHEAIGKIKTIEESYYIIDIACMATWGDSVIDKDEKKFLNQLGHDLKLDHHIITNAMESINFFYEKHKDKIALLSSKNLVKTFYDNSSKMVNKLISRNSKRLLNELRESKELMKLLTQSTVRDLNDDEQKKVNEQLLDIFKSIPSLAIFMLPGGALLLPLVIKFIPKLLPSAFDDNRIED